MYEQPPVRIPNIGLLFHPVIKFKRVSASECRTSCQHSLTVATISWLNLVSHFIQTAGCHASIGLPNSVCSVTCVFHGYISAHWTNAMRIIVWQGPTWHPWVLPNRRCSGCENNAATHYWSWGSHSCSAMLFKISHDMNISVVYKNKIIKMKIGPYS